MSIVPIIATVDEASTGALAAVSPNSPPPRFERAKDKRDHWEENRVMSISKKHPTVEEAHKKLGEYYVAEHDAIREKENFAKRAKKGHMLDGVLRHLHGELELNLRAQPPRVCALPT